MPTVNSLAMLALLGIGLWLLLVAWIGKFVNPLPAYYLPYAPYFVTGYDRQHHHQYSRHQSWHGGGGGHHRRSGHHGAAAAEGFIDFSASTAPKGSVTVPLYSTTKPVVKVFDNLFFDPTNGNLVEVLGPAFNSTDRADAIAPAATTTTTIAAPTIAPPNVMTKEEATAWLMANPGPTGPNGTFAQREMWLQNPTAPGSPFLQMPGLMPRIQELQTKTLESLMKYGPPPPATPPTPSTGVVVQSTPTAPAAAPAPAAAAAAAPTGGVAAASSASSASSAPSTPALDAAAIDATPPLKQSFTSRYSYDDDEEEEEEEEDEEEEDDGGGGDDEEEEEEWMEDEGGAMEEGLSLKKLAKKGTKTVNKTVKKAVNNRCDAAKLAAKTACGNAPKSASKTAKKAKKFLKNKKKKIGFTSGGISGINVVKRDSTVAAYPQPTGENAPVACPESLLSTVAESSRWFSYHTTGTTTDRYFVCYAAWGTDTYLHVINLTSNTAACSQRFSAATEVGGGSAHNLVYTNAAIAFTAAASSLQTARNASSSSSSASTATTVPGYPNAVYQVSPTGFFDAANGFLVLANPGAGQVVQYDRYGGTIASSTVPASVPPATTFTAWSVVQSADLFVYMAFGYDTVVMLIRNTKTVADPRYTLVDVARYNQSGAAQAAPPPAAAAAKGNGSGDMQKEVTSMLAAWLSLQLQQGQQQQGQQQQGQQQQPPAPLPTSGKATTASGGVVNLDDYVLKTQIPIIAATTASSAPPPPPPPPQPATSTTTTTPSAATATITKDATSVTGGADVASGKMDKVVPGSSGSSISFTSGPVAAVADNKKNKKEEEEAKEDAADGSTPDGQRKRTVRGIDPRSAFGAMIPNPSPFRPMPAGITPF